MNIACAFKMGNSLYRILSTRHGSPFMGKHFRFKVYTGGQLSLGAAIVKKVELWLCNIFVKVLGKQFL